jgi:hypothetical protein
MNKDLIKKIAETEAKAEDEAILKALIGAKIIDIKVEHVKNRKHMVIVTITHDGPPHVPLRSCNSSSLAVANINPIKLRVRL